jgi:toxin HigB-1
VIKSFADKATEELFHGVDTARSRRLAPIAPVAFRKLDIIHAAAALNDLRAPPGNRLEALKGALRGYHSIRINDQWRIVFRWQDGHAHEVRITDYH